VVDLAAAVRSMTSLPATVFRVSGHGVLREGAFADVVVFDLARVDDPATFRDPHRRRSRAAARGPRRKGAGMILTFIARTPNIIFP
jgi:N-acyl-D-aspartate/D-glutamate deacylase